MRKSDNSAPKAATGGPGGPLLLHLGPGLREATEPGAVYLVEAAVDDTRVRTRAARALHDVRPIGELEPLLVNPDRVRQVRRRPSGEDWELKLDPPVNRVLPVSRSALPALWAAFGEE